MTPALAPAPPRTKPPGVRREELMDAAEALFIAKSIAATSIDEIVAAAGVSKGGFYHHFASKDALLTALQERFVTDFLADIVTAQDARPRDDWRGRLDAWIDGSVSGFFERLAVHDVVFHEFRPADRREMNDNAVVEQLAGFLADGHAAGAWDVAAPRLVAIMLFHAMHGACDEAVIAPERFDQAMLIKTLRRFFWRVISPGA